MMAKKNITLTSVAKSIDSLAAMVLRGFEASRAETKDEFTKLRKEMHQEFGDAQERFRSHRSDIDTLSHRVKRLEKFTGIDK